MKFQVLLLIFLAVSISALPYQQSFLEDISRPYNRIRWPDSRIVGGKNEILKILKEIILNIKQKIIIFL